MHCQHSLLECGCLHVMLCSSANMPSLHNIIHGPVEWNNNVIHDQGLTIWCGMVQFASLYGLCMNYGMGVHVFCKTTARCTAQSERNRNKPEEFCLQRKWA